MTQLPKTKLIVLTSSSCLGKWITESIPPGATVIFTNVAYPEDQVEMNRLLLSKRQFYSESCVFHHQAREALSLMFNLTGSVCVLDNFNLLVSNLMLLHNFNGVGESEAYYSIVKMIDGMVFPYILGDNLTPQARYLGFDKTYIITSDVDFDFNVKTSYGRVYQRLMARYNSILAGFCDEVSILFHNKELVVK